MQELNFDELYESLDYAYWENTFNSARIHAVYNAFEQGLKDLTEDEIDSLSFKDLMNRFSDL